MIALAPPIFRPDRIRASKPFKYPPNLIYAEAAPAIVLYCYYGMEACVDAAFELAKAFDPAVAVKPYSGSSDLLPDLSRPPRFNYRISDFVYIANGDAQLKHGILDVCTQEDIIAVYFFQGAGRGSWVAW